jgi:shikimate kinase
MKSSLALIGFMATGKSAVGRVVAGKLDKEFVEMDDLIERKAGKSVPEIFEQDGEAAFRKLEIEAAREVSGAKNLIIACGGGVVLNEINIDRLKRESVIVCLTASPEVILKRALSEGETRPLLETPDKMASIRELLSFRESFYERAADMTIDTSKLDIGAVAEQVISKLKENESFNFQE